jgi:SAM-dependent methyltransferase
METYYWDQQMEYLKNSRYLIFNDDYLEFLIKQVWKLTKPIHIVDFGCGLGYLGLKFLPNLPKGSKYTGIDKGEKLIAHAREVFKELPYETEFIIGDLDELNIEEGKYDVAVCQAVLQHMSNPKVLLGKMIASVKMNGQVICIEPHWISHMAGYYVHEIQQSKINNLGILQKLYEMDAISTGKDGNIGRKLPVYMQELGLKNISSRISDCVHYINPDEGERKAQLFRLLCDEGFSAPVKNEEEFVSNLIGRGLTSEEAQKVLESEKYLDEEFTVHGLNYNTIFSPSMMISFGRK